MVRLWFIVSVLLSPVGTASKGQVTGTAEQKSNGDASPGIQIRSNGEMTVLTVVYEPEEGLGDGQEVANVDRDTVREGTVDYLRPP